MLSKRIELHDVEKISKINPESMTFVHKYQVDMSMRNLAPKTQKHYMYDLFQWLIYVLDHQQNKSVLQLTDEDITEFLFFCKSYGNNSARLKFRTSVISAFYKFMRKKKFISENPTEFIDRPKRGQSIIPQNYLTPEQIALLDRKSVV